MSISGCAPKNAPDERMNPDPEMDWLRRRFPTVRPIRDRDGNLVRWVPVREEADDAPDLKAG